MSTQRFTPEFKKKPSGRSLNEDIQSLRPATFRFAANQQ